MNWDVLIWIMLFILMATSIAGGIILYSKGTRPYVQAFSAGSTSIRKIIRNKPDKPTRPKFSSLI